ncbi:hypothetical protein DFH06DRAFT_1477055 [Mycena polygramma]|nr:hypothetical protein DFH06DRAFT_1477055 [Mycena polygramma]
MNELEERLMLEKYYIELEADREKDRIEAARDNPENEAAASKLWAVYISEAEKYDKGLVESWKSDMQGMLIFAGLFSASLTAFLVESYQALSRDSGDDTVRLLSQISQQLAAAANGTNFVVPPDPPFTPSASALICNTLWFISLGLSLACALIATLLDQWARDFLHRTDIRPSPVIRARVFSFLYYGLKRFKMHAVVEIIPLLLHASLLLFFAGLVAFLIPVNTVVMCVTAILLVLIASVYSLLTILPSLYPDCPYRTPLSGTCWQVLQKFNTAWTHAKLPSDGAQQVIKQTKTPIEHMLEKAREDSDERISRDRQALIWTVKSLADDAELEPFVEAIPDVIWDNHDRRRYVYDDHIRCLMEDPNIQLFNRILGLLDSCGSGLLSLEASTRRRISCYKALWTLSSLAICTASVPSLPFVPDSLRIAELDPELRSYAVSADALIAWIQFRAAQGLLDDILSLLHPYKADLIANKAPDCRPIQSRLDKLGSVYSIFLRTSGSLSEDYDPEVQPVDDLIGEIQGLSLTTHMGFLSAAIEWGTELIPYRFALTEKLIAPRTQIPVPSILLDGVRGRLDWLVNEYMGDILANEDEHWIDRVFRIFLSYWEPTAPGPAPALPWGVVYYMNNRSRKAVLEAGPVLGEGGWKSVPETIYHPPARPGNSRHNLASETPTGVLTAPLVLVWKLFESFDYPRRLNPEIATLEAILAAVLSNDLPSITPSVVAVVKNELVRRLRHLTLARDISQDLVSHSIFPLETSFIALMDYAPPDQQLEKFIQHRCNEAAVLNLASFIESCCSSEFLFEAAKTMRRLCRWDIRTTVHPTHQLRFATAVHNLVSTSGKYRDGNPIMHAIIGSSLLDIYFEPQTRCLVDWLDSIEARQLLKGTFTTYLTAYPGLRTSLDEAELEIIRRGQAIVKTLDSAPIVNSGVIGPGVPAAQSTSHSHELVHRGRRGGTYSSARSARRL